MMLLLICCCVHRSSEVLFSKPRTAPPPKKNTRSLEHLDPRIIHGFLGSTESTLQSAFRSVQPFPGGSPDEEESLWLAGLAKQ